MAWGELVMNIIETQVLANRIAQQFILAGSDLSEGIAKSAEERDLSRLQIQHLVSATNHLANDYLRKTAADKTYTFDLASLDRVVELLDDVSSDGVEVMKVASVMNNLTEQPSPELDAMHKLAQLGSADEQDRRRSEAKDLLRKIAARAATASREAEAQKIAEYEGIRRDIDELTDQVKQYLTTTQYTYGDIRKFASLVDTGSINIVDPVFQRVEAKLEKLGEPFRGHLAKGREATEETHNRVGVAVPEPEVTVINGEVPIVRTLGKLALRAETASMKEKLTHELSSLNTYAVTAEREFPDSASVDRYAIEELDTFYKGLCSCASDATVEKLAALPLLGTALRFGAKAVKGLNKLTKKTMGTGLAGTAVKAAGPAIVTDRALKAGGAIADKARKGVRYSAGGGAADQSAMKLS